MLMAREAGYPSRPGEGLVSREMMRWLVLGCCSLFAACAYGASTPANDLARPRDDRIVIVATDEGFRPNHIAVRSDRTTTFVFIRRTTKPCLREVVLYTEDERKLRRELPVGKEVAIAVRFKHPGKAGFTCGTGMYMGQIEVD